MPDGKLMSMLTFFKFLNRFRTGNMTIVKYSFQMVANLAKDFKNLTTRDNEDACATLRQFGAT